MNFIYKYSIDSEYKVIISTLNDRDFFIKNKYNIILPKNYTLDSKDLSNLKSVIENELNNEKINKIKDEISACWDKNETDLGSFLGDQPYLIPNELIITLTQYGVGGSYFCPNKIITNISNNKDPFKTVVHELIHLIIELPIIRKFNLTHWEKESLVDYKFMNDKHLRKIFPNYDFQKEKPSQELLKKIGWQH